MSRLAIAGLGTAVPEHTMTQGEAAEMARDICDVDERQQRLLNVLYRKSGVEQRRTALPHRIAREWKAEHALSSPESAYPGPTTAERMAYYEQHAFPLARQAAEQACTAGAIRPESITHLVTVSCTGFYAPGVDVQLIDQLGLPRTTERVHVGFMGCHGVLNALRVCRGLAAAEPEARVLLCAVELCCLHYRFQWDPERFLGNVLFADGAAALTLHHAAAGDAARWRIAATGSCLIPDSLDAMSWRIGDHGYEMMLSASVPELIGEHLRPWLCQWLDRQGISLDEVGFWAVHPGGPRILSAVEQSLELPPDALDVSREVLAQRGNMSSPTVLFILEQFRRRKVRGPGVMLGFGPGLMAEAALIETE